MPSNRRVAQNLDKPSFKLIRYDRDESPSAPRSRDGKGTRSKKTPDVHQPRYCTKLVSELLVALTPLELKNKIDRATPL